jgi:hypothetical protein
MADAPTGAVVTDVIAIGASPTGIRIGARSGIET